MSKIKVGVIGAGGIVRRLHLPDLNQNDNFEVVLISGRKESRLKQQCEVFGIPNWKAKASKRGQALHSDIFTFLQECMA